MSYDISQHLGWKFEVDTAIGAATHQYLWEASHLMKDRGIC
jgi:hypothetical protein